MRKVLSLAVVGLVALLGAQVAFASPTPSPPDPLAPLRSFFTSVTPPAALVALTYAERATMRAAMELTGLDALRHANSR